MKKTLLAASLSTLIFALPSYALPGLSADSVSKLNTNAVKSLASSLSTKVAQQESSPLVDKLTQSLSVTPEQATGGAGALLALASNSLASKESNELTSLIPGMSQLKSSASGLLGTANNLSAVNDVFSKLGLDPAMVSQFTPIILEYLTGQGASNNLLSSLGSLWK